MRVREICTLDRYECLLKLVIIFKSSFDDLLVDENIEYFVVVVVAECCYYCRLLLIPFDCLISNICLKLKIFLDSMFDVFSRDLYSYPDAFQVNENDEENI